MRRDHTVCHTTTSVRNLLYEQVGAWCRHEPVDWLPTEDEQWRDLIELARCEGVAGLLYTILPENVPTHVRDCLRADYQSHLAANLLYMEKLAQIVPALQSAGVRFAVVKGAALLTTAYHDMGARAMKDVDLLVHPDDANILKPVMEHLGWREEDEDIAGKGFGVRYRAERTFTRQEGSILFRVEAHLDAPGFYPASRGEIWSRITTASSADIGDMPVLSLPAHLSYLCAHYYYHHCGSGLKWLVDIARLVSQISSWHDTVVDAYQFGTTRPVHLALQEVRQVLKVPVPQHIVATLRFLPMPISLRILFELCKRPRLHYLGIRLLDIYRAPTWSIRLGYIWRKLTAPRWRKRRGQ